MSSTKYSCHREMNVRCCTANFQSTMAFCFIHSNPSLLPSLSALSRSTFMSSGSTQQTLQSVQESALLPVSCSFQLCSHFFWQSALQGSSSKKHVTAVTIPKSNSQVRRYTLPLIRFRFHRKCTPKTRDTHKKSIESGTALASRSCQFCFHHFHPWLDHFISCTLNKCSFTWWNVSSTVCHNFETFALRLYQDMSRTIPLTGFFNSFLEITAESSPLFSCSSPNLPDHRDNRRENLKGCNKVWEAPL